MQSYKIYSLRCPLTDHIFYVGCTAEKLEVRVKQSYTAPTVKELRKQGLQPVIELLEETTYVYRGTRENYWIQQLRAWGFNLENQVMPRHADTPFLISIYPTSAA